MTLTDQQVLDIVNALLDKAGVRRHERVAYLRTHIASSAIRTANVDASLRALGPVLDRYLEIEDPPSMCQVEHAHWEGPMICGNTLPCPRHGGR